MKLINHRLDNHYTINDSVMHGTIEVNKAEMEDMISSLKEEWINAVKQVRTYQRDSLAFIDGYKLKGQTLVCFGVCATRLIVKWYYLNGYKNRNYGIKIIK